MARFVVLGFEIFLKKTKTLLGPHPNKKIEFEISTHASSLSVLQSFSFDKLKSLTNNFDDRTVLAGGNKIGEGGFGVVYKGCINGRTVAVKKLTSVGFLLVCISSFAL